MLRAPLQELPAHRIPLRVKITVRCFAAVREITGLACLERDVQEGTTVSDLHRLLGAEFPALEQLRVAYAVNRDYAPVERVLAEGDEVALIPPISGGSGGAEIFRFELVDGVLDPRALEEEVRTDEDGALVTFQGVTRNHNDGLRVLGLSYQAYPEMAESVMVQIFEQALAKFAVSRARVVHRVGEVPVGEASVVVCVAAAHRQPAFAAARFLMDRLKAEVPIFKKERLDDGAGGERWVGELPGAE